MEKSRVKILFDRRKQSQETGFGEVTIRVYLNRNEIKFIPIKTIPAAEWPNFSESFIARDLVSQYEKVLDYMELTHQPMTKECFQQHLASAGLSKSSSKSTGAPTDKKNSFLNFFFDEIGAEKTAPRTRQARIVVYNELLRFNKIKRFEDLTSANILEFHKFIQRNGNRSTTTLKSYHKRLHRYVMKAFEYGYIERDPYRLVRIPTGQYKERKPLSEEELSLLRNLRLPPKEEKARDLFIFSAYTGLCYCDAQAFCYKTMAEKNGDLWYIDGNRIKSGSNYYTPILAPAYQILEKYDFRLPRMSNQKLNDYLHLVESRACLHKNLTSHLARHTFATLVLAQDVPVEDLARMLGHKDVRTTQHYAKILKTTIQRHAENLSKVLK